MNIGNTQTLERPDLRSLIRRRGLLLVYIAEQLEISPQNLNGKLNSGRFLPHQKVRLAEVLGMSVSELFPESQEAVR